jgi:hypothetical protein
MDPIAASSASADAINGLGTHFMMDMGTYAYGNELGFDGVDFYVSGRGGALGDVPAGVVTAAFVFWEPGAVAAAWERSAPVMPRRQAAEEFAGVAHRWADEHIPDAFPAARLAELAGRLGDAAPLACAPLFAGWRALPEPERRSPEGPRPAPGERAARAARCAARRRDHRPGRSPHAAVARRTPYMLGVFGWQEPHPTVDEVREPWKAAQVATERSVAPIFEALEPAEREELVELTNALQAAVTPRLIAALGDHRPTRR